jgi:hypothetical protein
VSARIKISGRILRSVEEGSTTGLPHAVYTKSFIRAFGLQVKYDPDELNAALEKLFPPLRRLLPAPGMGRARRPSRGARVRPPLFPVPFPLCPRTTLPLSSPPHPFRRELLPPLPNPVRTRRPWIFPPPFPPLPRGLAHLKPALFPGKREKPPLPGKRPLQESRGKTNF